MSRIIASIQYLSIPIIFLNIFAGIVAGIWLAVIGKWALLGIGIVFIFFGQFLLSGLLMPGLIFAPIGTYLRKRNNPLHYVVGFLFQAYINLVIIGWCGMALLICLKFYEGASRVELVPYALWSWEMALTAWQNMASAERDNEFTMITLFSLSMCYLLLLVSLFLGGSFTIAAACLFAVVHLVVLPLLNLSIAQREEALFYRRA